MSPMPMLRNSTIMVILSHSSATTRQGHAEGLAQGHAEGRVQGFAQGLAESSKDIAAKMIKKGYDLKEISELTGLALDEIEKLQNI